MRVLFWVSLFLFPSGSVAAAPTPEPSPLRFQIEASTRTATTGDMPLYRVSLTNVSQRSVRVPKNALKQIILQGSYARPGTALGEPTDPEISTGPGSAPGPTRILEPGASVDIHGAMKHIFSECASGCRSGKYRLSGTLQLLGGGAGADNNRGAGRLLAKRRDANFEFEVTPARLAREGKGMSFQISMPVWKDHRHLGFQAVIRNDSATPTWVALPRKTMVDCRYRVVTGPETLIIRTRSRARGYQNYNEEEGVLLHGGDETYLQFTCPRLQLREINEAHKIYVSARIRSAGQFYPLIRVESPYYLSSELRSNEAKLK